MTTNNNKTKYRHHLNRRMESQEKKEKKEKEIQLMQGSKGWMSSNQFDQRRPSMHDCS